jgi:hypothetical protein
MGDGWQSKEKLLEKNPDYFFENFKDIQEFVIKNRVFV